jgi:hypothetical protein
VYRDFEFADYVGVATRCKICHIPSPEFKNLEDMIAWVDMHQIDCVPDADL